MVSGWQSLGSAYWCGEEYEAVVAATNASWGCAWRNISSMLTAAWFPMRHANFTPCGRKCQTRLANLGADVSVPSQEQLRHAYGDLYGRYYTEIVLDRAAFEAALPQGDGIEAVFFVAGSVESETYARAAHFALTSAFGPSAAALVRFNVTNLEEPFQDATATL